MTRLELTIPDEIPQECGAGHLFVWRDGLGHWHASEALACQGRIYSVDVEPAPEPAFVAGLVPALVLLALLVRFETRRGRDARAA